MGGGGGVGTVVTLHTLAKRTANAGEAFEQSSACKSCGGDGEGGSSCSGLRKLSQKDAAARKFGGEMVYLFPPYSIGGQESAVVNAEIMRGAIWLLRE